jgi:hypothetical protein
MSPQPVQFESEAQLYDAYYGEFGPEIEEAAEEVMENLGWLTEDGELLREQGEDDLQPEDAPSEAAELAWVNEFMADELKLEKKIGRELTTNERSALIKDHALSTQPPDLLEAYDRVIGRDIKNEEDRLEVLAEHFDQAQSADESPEVGEEDEE